MSAPVRTLTLALLFAVAAGVYSWQRAARSDAARRPGPVRAAAPHTTAAHAPTLPAPSAPLSAPAAAAPGTPLRYIAVGGGATPESTEVSLEQNLSLLEQVLPGPGRLLFAGGSETSSVRVLDAAPASDPLLVRIGDFFQPRPGRGSRYRPSALPAAAASKTAVEAALGDALAHGDGPLILYFATHGEQGAQPRDNSVVLWAGGALTAEQLAALHDAHPRPLRVVNASCYSGGFAELAFAQADAARGPSRAPRCGLFAGTADRETSGCDPDPDRRNQEGYSLHFLHALRGRARDDTQLPAGSIDFDGDGRVSLLEAHTRAAIAARSIDVPTTTSQRYLRAVQASAARGASADGELLPEERALVRELGAALGMPSEAEAKRRHRAVDDELDEIDERLQQADAQVEERYGELAARLLGRWPVLDDAYHPQFAATLARERAAISAALDGWPEAVRYRDAERERDAMEVAFQALEVEEARLTRLLRAHETLGLAHALRRRGGAQLRHYQELLACERFAPIDR